MQNSNDDDRVYYPYHTAMYKHITFNINEIIDLNQYLYKGDWSIYTRIKNTLSQCEE